MFQQGIIALPAITDTMRLDVGNKAFNLARLEQAGLPVPRAFCLSVEFFCNHCRRKGGFVTLSEAGRSLLLNVYHRSGLGRVAVRSSALDEDGEQASGAGLYHTELSVTTDDALIAAVERCIASAHDPYVNSHQRCLGSNGEMAVLIQEMVEADLAGVLFTAGPLDGCDETMTVNATWGLGAPLVAGEVDGDLVQIDRAGRVRYSKIVAKPTRLGLDGRVAVDERDRYRPCLDDQLLCRLADLGCRIEARFGAPQDIEFAVSDRSIHILQVRPIPRFANACGQVHAYLQQQREKLRQLDRELKRSGAIGVQPLILSNGNIGELLPTPTPMSFGLFATLFAGRGGAIAAGRARLGYRITGEATEGLFQLLAGQPYFVLQLDARTYDIGLGQPIAEYVERVIADPDLANYPEVGLYEQHLSQSQLSARYGDEEGLRRYRMQEQFQAALRRKAAAFTERFPDTIEPQLKAYVDRQRQIRIDTLDLDALITRFHRLMAHLRTHTCVEFVIAARLGFCFTDRVLSHLKRCLPASAEDRLLKLLQGLEGSLICRQVEDLERLARGDLEERDFLHVYGHLSTNELEISLPRYHEEPALLRQQIGGCDTQSGQSSTQSLARTRKQAEQQLWQSLAQTGLGSAQRLEIAEDVRLAQHFLPLRETLKSYVAAEYDLIRQTLLAIAHRAGIDRDDVFYLQPDEISRLDNEPGATEQIRKRRYERTLARQLAEFRPLPAVVFADQARPFERHRVGATDGSWQGVAVAPGDRLGQVVIVDEDGLDAETIRRLDPHHILVSRSANLGLAPLIRKVGGLVTEVGGVLAHSACQAREAGVPAVVLPRATKLLAHGTVVWVDGTHGKVTRVEQQASVERAPEDAASGIGPARLGQMPFLGWRS